MQGCFLSEEPTTRRVDQPERLGFLVSPLLRVFVDLLHDISEKLLDCSEVSLIRV